MSDTAEVTHAVSREHDGSGFFSVLTPPYEVRIIVLAQGVQFVTPPGDEYHPHALLQSKFGLTTTMLDQNVLFYTSDVQQVHYFVPIITGRDAFRNALKIPNIQVIYAGHARHGEGPCFNEDDGPGEWWGDGDGPENGLFRMGYTFVAAPASSMVEHGYHATPVPAHESKPPADRDLCHPKILQNYSALAPKTISQLMPDAAHRAELVKHLRGATGDPSERFWGMVCRGDSGKVEPHLIVKAGWQSTATDPWDLGATEIQSKVFCHFGCSTMVHNYKIVRFLKQWQKEGDNHYAYWTTAAAPPILLAPTWLYHVFTYNKYSAFSSLDPLLRYAVTKTNQSVRRQGFAYSVK